MTARRPHVGLLAEQIFSAIAETRRTAAVTA